VLSQAFEQLTPALICLTVALNAQSLAEQVATLIGGQAVTDAGGVVSLWQALAIMLANTVIVSGGAWLIMELATGAQWLVSQASAAVVPVPVVNQVVAVHDRRNTTRLLGWYTRHKCCPPLLLTTVGSWTTALCR
jgi:hypothetical protein